MFLFFSPFMKFIIISNFAGLIITCKNIYIYISFDIICPYWHIQAYTVYIRGSINSQNFCDVICVNINCQSLKIMQRTHP